MSDAPRTVLIADDDMNLRMIVGLMLKREGYTVLEAHTGKMAAEMIRTHRPDVVLMDVMMPEFDGLTITRVIKQAHELQNIPVLIFTARKSREDIQKAVEAGADDYVVKPIDREALKQKLARALIPPEERARLRAARQAALASGSDAPRP